MPRSSKSPKKLTVTQAAALKRIQLERFSGHRNGAQPDLPHHKTLESLLGQLLIVIENGVYKLTKAGFAELQKPLD